MVAMPKPPFWVSDTRTPKCRKGHPYIHFRQNEGKMILETRGDCHHFLSCPQCGAYAFGVQSAAHEIIQWYDIPSKEMLDTMLAQPHMTKTWVFLNFLGFTEDEHAA